MLLQATSDGYKNMAVSRYPEMTQLLTSIDVDKAGNGTVTVTFRAFGSKEATKTLKVPLKPNIEKLEPFNVDMHGSPTAAFKMPTEYNTWFSECFGYDVVFVYLGDNRRDVLFKDLAPVPRVSWLANLTSSIINPDRFRITFADCAPYLIVSKTSLADVSSRLPPGQNMDVTKFRPNIVLEGAEEAWEEDYWRKIKIGNAEVTMNHNCVRCKSINVDYETGKPGTGESGEVLKKLQKDRRVDTGAKWSPVFGRYSFWSSKSADQMIKVGDLVEITEVSKERTAWSKFDIWYVYMRIANTCARLARYRMNESLFPMLQSIGWRFRRPEGCIYGVLEETLELTQSFASSRGGMSMSMFIRCSKTISLYRRVVYQDSVINTRSRCSLSLVSLSRLSCTVASSNYSFGSMPYTKVRRRYPVLKHTDLCCSFAKISRQESKVFEMV